MFVSIKLFVDDVWEKGGSSTYAAGRDDGDVASGAAGSGGGEGGEAGKEDSGELHFDGLGGLVGFGGWWFVLRVLR